IGGGSFLRAASVAARKVSEVRSSAVPRSAQRRTKYPYTIGNAWSYKASSAPAASLGSVSALTLSSSRWRRNFRRVSAKNSSGRRYSQVTGGPCGEHTPSSRSSPPGQQRARTANSTGASGGRRWGLGG